MRAIRALRILKLLRFMPSLNVFWRAIVSARHQLILFYSFIAIVMVIFGSLMYLIEGPEYGFTTLNASVYWAIVTITTVGYGDITPHTPLGRILGLHSYPDRLLHYCHTDRTYHHAYDQRPESSTTAAPVSAVSAGRP